MIESNIQFVDSSKPLIPPYMKSKRHFVCYGINPLPKSYLGDFSELHCPESGCHDLPHTATDLCNGPAAQIASDTEWDPVLPTFFFRKEKK